MTEQEIDKFIENNSDESVKEFFNLLLVKLDSSNKRNDKLSLLMGLLILLYFLFDEKMVSSISLGPVSITDLNLAKLFIPLVFAFILLIYATLNAHRTDVLRNIRQIGIRLYNIEENGKQEFYSNTFLQLIMPFSMWEELNSKYLKDGKTVCLTLLLTLPIFPLIFSPFVFECYALKILFTEKWSVGLMEKVVIVSTIWIILSAVIYYVKLFAMKIKEELKK